MIHLTCYSNDDTFAINPAHIVALFRNVNHPEYTDIITVAGEFTARENYATITAQIAGEPTADVLPTLEMLVKVIEEWPSIHEDGDYLHGYPLNAARAAIAKATVEGK